MPESSVLSYVRDKLELDFKLDIDSLPDHWIPLTIVGTLDWVVLSGWWVFRNTGIYQSDDPYKFVFEYEGYEFDPDQLLVFREDAERHKLMERLDSPGITGKERTEALPFLAKDIFNAWLKSTHGLNDEEADEFIPPTGFIEMAMYSTFIWILDKYGRDWIYMQDELLACAMEHSAAFLSLWDNTLLDPNIMLCTNRPLNSCRYCNEVLHCVMGSEVNKMWQFVCNNCLMVMKTESHHHLDKKEERLQQPRCPQWLGQDGTAGTCIAECPHSGTTAESKWEKMEEAGTQRVEAYKDHIEELGGLHPRHVAGQSVRDIVDHFNDPALTGRRTKRLRED